VTLELIGHRGCGGQYPENTVSAVERAAGHVSAVEVDVRRCGSGELVVFHDDRLDRLTGREGRVGETPLETLRDLTIMATGDDIPRLETLLDAVPAETDVLLETKSRGIAAETLAVAERFDNRTTLISFEERDLRDARETRADAALGYIYTRDPEPNLRTTARLDDELGLACVHVYHGFCHRRSYPDSLHQLGLDVHAGTVSTVEQANAVADVLADAGVERLSTDRWDVVPPAATA
jgi:glycerophosphoryl diester phosphodiesterase